ncbi:hypothetical protein TNCV_2389651 [Trichonephila clavipes]|nr:hypothetical protein TNCV_2389651 [Trichonephila clavipes]
MELHDRLYCEIATCIKSNDPTGMHMRKRTVDKLKSWEWDMDYMASPCPRDHNVFPKWQTTSFEYATPDLDHNDEHDLVRCYNGEYLLPLNLIQRHTKRTIDAIGYRWQAFQKSCGAQGPTFSATILDAELQQDNAYPHVIRNVQAFNS